MYRAVGKLGGFAGFLLFPALVWIVMSLSAIKHSNQAPGEVEAARLKRLATVQAEQTGQVTVTGWVDKEKNKVRIPVEAAAKVVLPELQSKKPKASSLLIPGRTPPPVAAPAQPAPAPAPTPAPPASGPAPAPVPAPPASPAPAPSGAPTPKPAPLPAPQPPAGSPAAGAAGPGSDKGK